MNNIKEIVNKQRNYFNQGNTLDIKFRIEQLKKLGKAINSYEAEIFAALKADLNKPSFEAYSSEIMQLKGELKYTVNRLKRWAKPQKVKTSFELQPGKSRVYAQPFGVVLNIAPWNYPFQTCLVPLVSILAAGNCAVIKPSEFAPQSSKLIAKIIGEIYPVEYCAVVEGGVEETQLLLAQKWDFIAFTGSPKVGHIVAEAAAQHLTPTLLELGGKSPCIVHSDADIKVAAHRIAWGKFMNAGQTCTAPDFVLAHKSIAHQLAQELTVRIEESYGKNAKDSPDYCRIVTNKHFDRLVSYLEKDKLFFGGKTNSSSRYIEPTILYKSDWDDKIMQEEIFGPLLPIIEYGNIDDAITKIKEMERPLALYFFSKNKILQNCIIESIHFGGGCINATVLHNGNIELPFSGIGNSGMGRYHGKSGFDTFSYSKSIYKKPTCIDPSLIYPPYKQKVNLLKKIS